MAITPVPLTRCVGLSTGEAWEAWLIQLLVMLMLPMLQLQPAGHPSNIGELRGCCRELQAVMHARPRKCLLAGSMLPMMVVMRCLTVKHLRI